MSTIDAITPDMHAGLKERIARFIDTHHPQGCWLWLGTKDPDGYARIKIKGQQHRAHRVSLLVFAKKNDPKPAPHAQANHRCYNRLCVNPAHLYWGSHQENMQDLRSSGRLKARYDHGRVTVTPESVKAIQILHASGEFSQMAIGRILRIRPQLVSEIVRGKHFSTRTS